MTRPASLAELFALVHAEIFAAHRGEVTPLAALLGPGGGDPSPTLDGAPRLLVWNRPPGAAPLPAEFRFTTPHGYEVATPLLAVRVGRRLAALRALRGWLHARGWFWAYDRLGPRSVFALACGEPAWVARYCPGRGT